MTNQSKQDSMISFSVQPSINLEPDISADPATSYLKNDTQTDTSVTNKQTNVHTTSNTTQQNPPENNNNITHINNLAAKHIQLPDHQKNAQINDEVALNNKNVVFFDGNNSKNLDEVEENFASQKVLEQQTQLTSQNILQQAEFNILQKLQANTAPVQGSISILQPADMMRRSQKQEYNQNVNGTASFIARKSSNCRKNSQNDKNKDENPENDTSVAAVTIELQNNSTKQDKSVKFTENSIAQQLNTATCQSILVKDNTSQNLELITENNQPSTAAILLEPTKMSGQVELPVSLLVTEKSEKQEIQEDTHHTLKPVSKVATVEPPTEVEGKMKTDNTLTYTEPTKDTSKIIYEVSRITETQTQNVTQNHSQTQAKNTSQHVNTSSKAERQQPEPYKLQNVSNTQHKHRKERRHKETREKRELRKNKEIEANSVTVNQSMTYTSTRETLDKKRHIHKKSQQANLEGLGGLIFVFCL